MMIQYDWNTDTEGVFGLDSCFGRELNLIDRLGHLNDKAALTIVPSIRLENASSTPHNASGFPGALKPVAFPRVRSARF